MFGQPDSPPGQLDGSAQHRRAPFIERKPLFRGQRIDEYDAGDFFRIHGRVHAHHHAAKAMSHDNAREGHSRRLHGEPHFFNEFPRDLGAIVCRRPAQSGPVVRVDGSKLGDLMIDQAPAQDRCRDARLKDHRRATAALLLDVELAAADIEELARRGIENRIVYLAFALITPDKFGDHVLLL